MNELIPRKMEHDLNIFVKVDPASALMSSFLILLVLFVRYKLIQTQTTA